MRLNNLYNIKIGAISHVTPIFLCFAFNIMHIQSSRFCPKFFKNYVKFIFVVRIDLPVKIMVKFYSEDDARTS